MCECTVSEIRVKESAIDPARREHDDACRMAVVALCGHLAAAPMSAEDLEHLASALREFVVGVEQMLAAARKREAGSEGS